MSIALMNRRRRIASGVSSFDIITLFDGASAGDGCFYNTRTADDLWTDAGRTTSAGDGDNVYGLTDSSGLGAHGDADATDGPVYSLANKALDYDQASEHAIQTDNFFDGATVYTVMYAMKSTDTDFVAFGRENSTTTFVFAAQDGSPSEALHSAAGTSPAMYVDGTLFTGTTRGDVHTSLATGNWVHVRLTGVGDNGAWSSQGGVFMSYEGSGLKYDGLLGSPLVIKESLLSAEDITNAQNWYATEYGMTF